MAQVDAELATEVVGWGALSVAKTEAAIDYWVDRYDPYAVVRTELSARGRYIDVVAGADGTGLSGVEGPLFGQDAAALDKRLDAMARGVCGGDPRTLEQRRADALGALAHGGDRLACQCGGPDCAAAAAAPSTVVINVVAEEKSLSDDTVVQLDGAGTPGPTTAQLREMTIAEALARPAPTRSATTDPAVVMGGGIMPAPLVAAKLATTATIRLVIHPGDSRARAEVCAVGGVGPVCPMPGSDVSLPGLRRTRRCLRCGPYDPVSGGANVCVKHQMLVPKTPPAQDLLRLVR